MQYVINRYMKDIPELSDSVGLIDPMLCDIDRGRAAQAHGKLGDERIKNRLYLLSLRKLRIPLLLFVNLSLLAQRGECDLASSVLNNLAQTFSTANAADATACFNESMIFVFSSGEKSSE